MNPRVSEIKDFKGYTLILKFTNGEVRAYNVTPLLNFGVFATLQDERIFRQAKVEYGTVIWPGDIDICPDTLYEDGVVIGQQSNNTANHTLPNGRGGCS